MHATLRVQDGEDLVLDPLFNHVHRVEEGLEDVAESLISVLRSRLFLVKKVGEKASRFQFIPRSV